MKYLYLLFLFNLLLLFHLSSSRIEIGTKETSSKIDEEENEITDADSYQYWPMPQFQDLYIIYNLSYLQRLLTSPKLSNRIIIAMVSVNLQIDSYLTLYIGYLQYLFESLFPSQVTFIIYEPSQRLDRIQATIFYLSLLPKKTIFVSMEHGPSSFGINSFDMLRDYDIGPVILYHANHEQPWITNLHDNQLDYTYSTIHDLQTAYSKLLVVIRNYYYAPLTPFSQYLPINAPYYSFLLNNQSSPLRPYLRIPASQRRFKCVFRGRTNYSSRYYENTDITSERQRNILAELANTNQLDECQFSEMNVARPGQRVSMVPVYVEYMTLIVQAAFVLCPAGNNPETFRLREALEVGAIPIIIRSDDNNQDFLQDELWRDYPGPVFNSWYDVNPFLKTITARDIDTLQTKVMTWFQNFQKKILSTLSEKLTNAFEILDRSPHLYLQRKLSSLRQIVRVEEEEVVSNDGSSQRRNGQEVFVKYKILEAPPPMSDLAGEEEDDSDGESDERRIGHHFYVRHEKHLARDLYVAEDIQDDDHLLIEEKKGNLPSKESNHNEDTMKTILIALIKQEERIKKLEEDNKNIKQLLRNLLENQQ